MRVQLQFLWGGGGGEGAVVIPVIMQTPDRALTRRNQMRRDDDIFSKVEQKTNKQRRTARFIVTFDPDT